MQVCGKQGHNLMLLRKKIERKNNQRCIIDNFFESNTLVVHTTDNQMLEAQRLVLKCTDKEWEWMDKECVEKALVTNSCRKISSPALLFGVGGSIRDVLMPGDYAAVEVIYEKCARFKEEDDDKLLELFGQCGEGVYGYKKFSPVPALENALLRVVDDEKYEWGIIRFCSQSSAEVAIELMNGATIK